MTVNSQNNDTNPTTFEIEDEESAPKNLFNRFKLDDILKVLLRKSVTFLGLTIILFEILNLLALETMMDTEIRKWKDSKYWYTLPLYVIEFIAGITGVILGLFPNVKLLCITIAFNAMGFFSPLSDIIYNRLWIHSKFSVNHYKNWKPNYNALHNRPHLTAVADRDVLIPEPSWIIGLNITLHVPTLIMICNIGLIFISATSLVQLEDIRQNTWRTSRFSRHHILQCVGLIIILVGFLASIYSDTIIRVLSIFSKYELKHHTFANFHLNFLYFPCGLFCLYYIRSRSKSKVQLLIVGLITLVITTVHMITFWRNYKKADVQETAILDNCIQGEELCCHVCNEEEFNCDTFCQPVSQMCNGKADSFTVRHHQEMGIGCQISGLNPKWNVNKVYIHW